jgi:hypothetical protein
MAEHPPKDKKIDIEVVVNGQPTTVEANQNAPLQTVIPKALTATGNTGQGPENWELRNDAGTLLDASQKISSFGFAAGVRLFLNLKAGVGGSC